MLGKRKYLHTFETEIGSGESRMMGNYHVRFGGQGNQSTDPYSLLAICLIIQILSGVTLAING